MDNYYDGALGSPPALAPGCLGVALGSPPAPVPGCLAYMYVPALVPALVPGGLAYHQDGMRPKCGSRGITIIRKIISGYQLILVDIGGH